VIVGVLAITGMLGSLASSISLIVSSRNLDIKTAWGKRLDYYLVIGRFKYWVIEDVLNLAASLSNADVRRRGLRYLARHGKKIGPWGRLINVKKRKR
jgi:hypothetical protein